MDADTTPDFDKMTGKELDAYGMETGVNAPDNWSRMKVAEKRKYLADLPDEGPGPSPETADPPLGVATVVNFDAMSGDELDAWVEDSAAVINVPDDWNFLSDDDKRAFLSTLPDAPADEPKTETADPPPYDLTDAVRRFKERRLRMSVRDILALACALQVRDWQSLAYDQLRKRMRIAIRDARNS